MPQMEDEWKNKGNLTVNNKTKLNLKGLANELYCVLLFGGKISSKLNKIFLFKRFWSKMMDRVPKQHDKRNKRC